MQKTCNLGKTKVVSGTSSTRCESHYRTILYDGPNVIAEYNSDGELLKSYIHAPGIDNPLAEIAYNGSDETWHYYLKDGQGSVAAITESDALAATVAFYDYSAFGSLIPETSSPAPEADGQPTANFMYTGREYNPESGDYYFRWRTYSPTSGRFSGADPSGYTDGWNLYSSYFAAGGRDPWGFQEEYPDVDVRIQASLRADIIQSKRREAPGIENLLPEQDTCWWIGCEGDVSGWQYVTELTTHGGRTALHGTAGAFDLGMGNYVMGPLLLADTLDQGAAFTHTLLTKHGSKTFGQMGLEATSEYITADETYGTYAYEGVEAGLDIYASRRLGLALRKKWSSVEEATLKNADDVVQQFGNVRTLAGYQMTGDAVRVGSTYKVDIAIWRRIPGGESGIKTFVEALKTEAQTAGASNLTITIRGISHPKLKQVDFLTRTATRYGLKVEAAQPSKTVLTSVVSN